jgi:hypothetical protein
MLFQSLRRKQMRVAVGRAFEPVPLAGSQGWGFFFTVNYSRFTNMKFIKSVGTILAAAFCIVLINATAQAQVFSQDFSSSAVVADYVSATPNTGQFNAISTNGAGTVVSINSGTLQFARTADTGIFSRTTDLTSPGPTSFLYKFDVTVSGNSVVAQTAGRFQVGSGYSTTVNLAEGNPDTYVQLGINFTATNGTFQIRDITNATDSASFSGTQTITWAMNNSGFTFTYLAPDGSTESLANDRTDIWVGTTRVFNDVAVQTASQSMTDLKFSFGQGVGNIQIDNIQINTILTDGLFYRSVGTGNWSSAATWESSTDNVTFTPAVHAPNSDSNSITVRSPHTVTVTSDVPVDQVVIDSGAQVTMNSTVAWTLVNGTGTDLTVNGTLLNSGLTLFGATVPTPTWTVGSGGTYIHNTTAGIATPIATASLDPASNFIYRGSSTLNASVSFSGRTYGNLSFESTSGTWIPSAITGTTATAINGDFTIGTNVSITGMTYTGVLTIAGNFTQNGTLAFSTGTQNFTFSGSGKTISGGGAIAFETWNVNSGASITLGSNVSIASTFTGTISGTLNCGTNLVSGAGAFTLASGGTLGIGSVDGITSSGATGNIQNTGTRTFNTGANYTYSGGAAQVTGNGLPATVNNLTINNASGVGLSSSVAVSSALTLTSGTFSIGANTLSISNPIAGTPTNLAGGATSSITIAGSASGINLPGTISALNNLTLNNGSGTALPGSLTLGGTLTLTSGALSIGANTLTLNGAIATTGGSLTGGSSSNITFGGAGASTALPAVTLNDLTINRANGISLGGNVTAGGILALTSGDISTTDLFILTENGTSSGSGDVVGTVQRSDLGATPVAFGNPNNRISIDSGTITSATMYLDKGETPTDFPQSVLRNYAITPGAGSLTQATVRLHYLDSELNLNTEDATLHLWRNSGGWVDVGQSNADFTDDWVEYNNVTGFSPWTISGPQAPTAVRLTKLNAASFADGVQLSWESGFEVNNLGYHIYREQDGVRMRVTPSPVAGSALKVGPGARMTAGYSYSWFDANGTPGASYYLESIDLNGTREMSGPVYPTSGAGAGRSSARKRAVLLNELARSTENMLAFASGLNQSDRPAAMKATAAVIAPNSASANSANLKRQQEIAAGRAVKITVPRSGWYRVTQPELLAAGLDPNSDPRRLQLFVAGEELPIRVNGDQSRLGTSDSIEFYGVALDTPATDSQVYWLVNGGSPGLRLSSGKRSKVKPGDTNWADGYRSGGGFAMTTERKDKLVYFSGLLNGDAENIFGPPVTADPLTQVLTVKNIDREGPAEVQVSVTLQGLTAGEHVVEIQLNGHSLGAINFSGLSHPAQTFSVDRSVLREGENNITLTSTNGEADVSLVDTVGLTYGHAYLADGNALRFSATTGQAIVVGGFSSPDIRVIDITDHNNPNDLTVAVGPKGSGYAFKLQPTGPGTRTFLAFTDDLAQHASLAANQPSTLNVPRSADMLIVTHRDFRAAVEPLAAQRRSEGLQVSVVDIEDVYDEFSYGVHSPFALRDFISWVSTHWQAAPRYLLLAGDSTWDPRNYLGQVNGDFVPTKLVDTAYMETASDDWLADLNGDGVSDIALGRLPGGTAKEVSRMVAKILLYEQERQLGTPARGALLVADTGFEAKSGAMAALLPANVAVQAINRLAVGSDDVMRGQIINSLDQGPMIVNYFGHGSVTVWTGAGLLDSDLALGLTNNSKPTLFVMMTCLNGYAHDAYIDSLGESLLKSETGGAMAVWASSGFTEPGPQFTMSQMFYQQLFSGTGVRLGDAVRAAKGATPDSDVRRTWMLLGDPTMRIR